MANLPYNVATPLVLRMLDQVPAVDALLVMVQREVGERMAAAAGRPGLRRGLGAGRLLRARPRWSAGSRRRCSCRGRGWSRCWCASIRRPAPAVDPALVSYERLDAVVRAGFAQRRKMLRRSLAGVVDPDAFDRAGVRPEARAEELDVAAWGRLAALLTDCWRRPS